MLDIKLIRRDPDMVRRAIENKRQGGDVDKILALDEQRKELTHRAESLRHERKTLSADIGRLMKESKAGEAEKPKKRVAEIKDEMKDAETWLAEVDNALKSEMLLIPNIPLDDVPVGKDEKDNKPVSTHGEPSCLAFKARPHWELGEALGILDLTAGSKISGTGFPVFTGMGARLVRGLINFMLDLHTTEFGYKEAWVPPLVNRDSMTGTGQLPKFEFDMYRIEADDMFLIPTAEVPVTNLVRGDNLLYRDLPLRYCAYTPCFRREAGSHGKDTRGLTRVHWFDKVELVSFCKPEDSPAEHKHMLAAAEEVLKRLGLTYRVSILCTGEMSFSNAKCFDIEVWCPGVNKWLEVSSVSTFTDFQSRRMNTRFRGEDGKLHFLHTLNGSGVALPRLIIALLEFYQQKDGGVKVPEPLVSYLDGVELIK